MDNLVFRGLGKLVDYVFVSILWCIGCIPVITIGASTAALFHTCRECLLDNCGHIWTEFRVSFLKNLLSSVIITMCLELFFFMLQIDMYLLGTQNKAIEMLLVAVRLICIYLLVPLFPLLAGEKCAVKEIPVLFKKSAVLSIQYLPRTLLCLIILGLCALGVYIVPLALILIPACGGVVWNFVIFRILPKNKQTEDKT